MTNPTTIDVIVSELVTVRQESDVIHLTSHIRRQAAAMGMTMLGQTKLNTAASELARNMLVHATGGTAQIDQVSNGIKTGIRLIFSDTGPGITNPEQAMRSGYSTGSGMGLGLPGAKKLADEFSLTSIVGEGTTVTILKWAND